MISTNLPLTSVYTISGAFTSRRARGALSYGETARRCPYGSNLAHGETPEYCDHGPESRVRTGGCPEDDTPVGIRSTTSPSNTGNSSPVPFKTCTLVGGSTQSSVTNPTDSSKVTCSPMTARRSWSAFARSARLDSKNSPTFLSLPNPNLRRNSTLRL